MSRILTAILEKTDALELLWLGDSTPKQMDPQREGLVCGQNLPNRLESVDGLAADLGLKPLSSFVRESDSVVEISLEMAEEEGDEERAAELRRAIENPSWYAPADGLAVVEPLISYLLGHPEALGDQEATWWVVWDLRAIELILREASNRGDRFALEEA